MRSEWKKACLGDLLAHIIDHRGRTPKKLGGDFCSSGIRVLSAKNIKDGRINYTSEMRYVSQEMYQRWMPVKLERGDILLTSEAPLGELAYLRDDIEFCLGQRLFALRTDKTRLHSRYLYYYLRSQEGQHKLHARATGTTAQGIRQSELVKAEIEYPQDTNEQRAIAHILGTLDDKIELNERMNHTLEVIAQAIFKSWFVDFEPFRDGEFVESKLGRIPKGWEVARFTDVMLVNPKRSLKKGSVAKHVDMKALPERGARVREWSERVYKGSGARFQNGDVLLARITPCLENGKTAYVDFLDEGEVGFGSTEFIVLRCPEGWPLEYMYFLARSEPFRSFAIQNMTGTSGRQRVPADCFKQFFIAVPPSDVLAKFGKLAKAVFALMKANDEEVRTLAQIRDALLPKLISGEIRVKVNHNEEVQSGTNS